MAERAPWPLRSWSGGWAPVGCRSAASACARGEVRPIDDFSEWGLNGLLATHEVIDLGGVDEVAGLANLWVHAQGAGGWVRVGLECGRVLEGWLAADWAEGSAAHTGSVQ